MTYVQAESLKNEMAEAKLAIHDLERLGIIMQRPELDIKKPSEWQLRSIESVTAFIRDSELDSIYFFTEYGLSFVRHVTPATNMNTEEVGE